MSANIDDGGPAFATATCGDWQIGMTLRDWFAGQALNGYLSGRNNTRGENPMNFEAERAATDCYRYADAMLAARKGTIS